MPLAPGVGDMDPQDFEGDPTSLDHLEFGPELYLRAADAADDRAVATADALALHEGMTLNEVAARRDASEETAGTETDDMSEISAARLVIGGGVYVGIVGVAAVVGLGIRGIGMLEDKFKETREAVSRLGSS